MLFTNFYTFSAPSKTRKLLLNVFTFITTVLLFFNTVSPVIVFAISEIDQDPEGIEEQEDSTISEDQEEEEDMEDDTEEEEEGNEQSETDESETDDALEVDETENTENEDIQNQDSSTEQENKNSTNNIWTENNGVYELTNPIEKDVVYKLDNLDGLQIIFTKIPNPSGKIYASETSSYDYVNGSEVLGKAYDITSDMINGTFQYTLYLPKPYIPEGRTPQVMYSEDGTTFQSISPVIVDDEYLILENLDHFTTYIVIINVPPPPISFLGIIVDNSDPDPEFTTAGVWNESAGVPTAYNGSYMSPLSNSGSEQAIWQFEVVESGTHEFSAWWPVDPLFATNSVYTITHEGGADSFTVDQSINGSQWNFLGSFEFVTGTSYTVTLDSVAAGANMAADAILLRTIDSPSTVWVDDDWGGAVIGDDLGSNRFYQYNAFATTQEGIDAVNETGVVNVAEGVYEEQIEINKELTLTGAGAGLTTILSPVTLASKFSTTIENYPIVFIENIDNVVIENLTVDGAGRWNGSGGFEGVAFRDAGGTVQNCEIINIRETPLGNTNPNHGIGLYAYNNLFPTILDIHILNNTFLNYQKVGILAQVDVNATINGNTIVGSGPIDTIAQNGIQLSFYGTGIISNNTIHNHYCNSADIHATGILFYSAGDIPQGPQVINNEIYDNEVGLDNDEGLVIPTVPIHAHHNNFHDNLLHAQDERSDSQWDDGSEGNIWDDYTGVDLNSDGVGDTELPYQLQNNDDIGSTQDNYPLTSNLLTPPTIINPPNDSYGNSTDFPTIDWTDAVGTYPPFEYEIQGFTDSDYTLLSWSPGALLTLSELSTTQVPDGAHYIRVRAYDANGNISYWSNDPLVPYIFSLDNTPPITDDPLISPLSDSYWSTNIPIIGNSSDNFSTRFVDIFYRSAGTADPWILITTLTNPSFTPTYPWTYSWDPSIAGGGPGEGIYDVRAAATDEAGNIESSAYAYNVTYDVIPPTQPQGLTIYRGHDPGTRVEIGCGGYTNDPNITVEWDLNPEPDIEYYWFGISGNVYHSQVISPTHEYLADLTSEGEPYTIIAVDLAGNESVPSNSCGVVFDQIAPFVEITAPIDALQSQNVPIYGTVIDAYPSDYQVIIEDSLGTIIDGTGIVNDPNSFIDQLLFDWNTTGVSDGIYTIRLLAWDLAQNQGEDTFDVTVDNSPPVTIISSPSNDSYWNSPIEVAGTSTDVNIASELHIYYRSSGSSDPWSQITILNNPSLTSVYDWTYSWDPSAPGGPSEGIYDLSIYSVDSLGNEESSLYINNITFDTSSPTSDIYIVGNLEEDGPVIGTSGWHGNGWYETYENINVLIDSGDQINDFINYQVLSGIVPCPAIGNGNYSQVAHDTNLNSSVNGSDGEYTVCYYSQDLSGNTESLVNTQLLRVDDTSPTFTVDSVTGNYVSGVYYNDTDSVAVTFTANDNLAGYTQARFDLYANHDCATNYQDRYFDNLLPPELVSTQDLSIAGLSDDNYCLVISVLDDAQNISNQESVLFTIDTAIPTVIIEQPTDILLSQIVSIYGTVTDTNLDNYRLFIEDSLANIVEDTGTIYSSVSFTNEFILDWDTTTISDGDYNIRLQAQDTAGNTNEDTLLVTIDNTPPETVVSSPTDDSFWNIPIPIEGTSTDVHILQTVYINYRAAGTTDPWTQITTLNNPDPTSVYNWAFAWDPISGPGEGTYDLLVYSSDELGNLETGVIVQNITYDITAPTSEVNIVGNLGITGATPGTFGWHNGWYEYYHNINVLIDSGNTANDFIMYQILPGISICPAVGDPSYLQASHNTNLSSLVNGNDGEYTLCYYGQDLSGNTESPLHAQLLRIDDTDPTFTIDFNSITGNNVSGVYYQDTDSITVPITAHDNLAGYSYTEAWYDLYEADNDDNCTTTLIEQNQLSIILDMSQDLTVTVLPIPPAVSPDGHYCLRLSVLDDSQNISTEEIVNFVIDTEVPIVEITDPLDGSIVSGIVPINGNIEETNLDYYHIILYESDPINFEWQDIQYIQTDPITHLLDVHYDLDTAQDPPNDIPDGTYTLSLIAYDLSGNSSEYSITITIDNTKPLLDRIEHIIDNNPVLIEDLLLHSDEGTDINVDITGTDDVGVTSICYQIPEIDQFSDLLDYQCIAGTGTEYTWSLALAELYSELLQDGTYTLAFYFIDSSDPSNFSDWDPEAAGDQPYLLTINVANIAPSITLPPNQLIIEGGSINPSIVSFVDPSYVEGSGNTPDDAPWSITIDYGDGTPFVNLPQMFTPGNFTIPAHTYVFDGNYKVTVTVSENSQEPGDGEKSSVSFQVSVQNNQPTVSILAQPSQVVTVGTQVILEAIVTGGNEPYEYTWSGACLGDLYTTFAPNTIGQHTCIVNITDADGDVASSTILITVEPRPIQVVYYPSGEQDEQEGQEEDTEEEESDTILGIRDCTDKSKVSGFVFFDKDNDNDKSDEDELFDNIQIDIFFSNEQGLEFIESVYTNSNGYWESHLCPGKYLIVLQKDSIPEDLHIEEFDQLYITVEKNTDISDINFILKNNSNNINYKWLLCILPLLTLLGLAIILIFYRKK